MTPCGETRRTVIAIEEFIRSLGEIDSYVDFEYIENIENEIFPEFNNHFQKSIDECRQNFI